MEFTREELKILRNGLNAFLDEDWEDHPEYAKLHTKISNHLGMETTWSDEYDEDAGKTNSETKLGA